MDDGMGCYRPSDQGFAGDAPSGRNGRERRGASTILESTNTEWTDEKHSMYLNSIEESFVNQLYNCNYHDPRSWLMRNQRDSYSSGSASNNMYSGQYKVQQKGYCGEVKFERNQTGTDIDNDSRPFSSNPWIQHFRSPKSGCQSHDLTGCGASSSSMLLPTCSQDAYHLESVGSSAEASDQNFADNDWERESQIRRGCRKRRPRNAVRNTTSKD